MRKQCRERKKKDKEKRQKEDEKKKEEKKIMCYRCKSGQHTDLVGVSVIN